MTSLGRAAFALVSAFTFAACVLDFEGLNGGARPGGDDAGDSGSTDTGTTSDATPSEGGGGDAGGDVVTPADCPGTHGPKAVRVTSGSTSFCIDSTEVTNAQYAEFLATNPTTNTISACSGNTFVPSSSWPGEASLPVVFVDWCDAYAFCEWAGKRLCGRIGGQHLDLQSRNDPAQSQWFFACSANGAKTYPYGATFDQTACNAGGSRTAAGSKASCQGGFTGVFDMSGNVEEWTDECSTDFSDCSSRGGNYSDSDGFECSTANVRTTVRTTGEAWRGFRCCGP